MLSSELKRGIRGKEAEEQNGRDEHITVKHRRPFHFRGYI